MMSFGIFVSMLCVANGMVNMKEVFDDWKLKQSKNYETSLEERYRFSVFSQNYADIKFRNTLNRTVTLGLNKFADLTNEEFVSNHLKGYISKPYSQNLRKSLPNMKALPNEVDWVAKGAVTPVKNQGQCGSCWSFSTTGSVEGAWFIATGKLESLSEQQLVDCSGAEGNQGCNGGMMDNAFQYIIKNGGICSEAEYGYTAQDGNCTSCNPVAKISSYVDVTPNSTQALYDSSCSTASISSSGSRWS